MTAYASRAKVLGRRFLLLFVAPQVVFAVAAALTNAPWLIAVLNTVTLALSVGVCAAFLPAVIGIFLKAGPIDRSEFLAFGIWLTWCAAILQAGWSMLWRWKGMPLWMASTDFTSYFLFMRVCGAVCHLAAPGAINDRIPPRRWLLIGLMIATAVFAAIVAGWMLDVVALRDIGRLAG